MFDEFKSAFQRYNNAHVQLIIINVVVFLAIAVVVVISQIAKVPVVGDVVKENFSIHPSFEVFITRPWTLITYFFAHSLADFFHILFNMLVFYWFGRLFIEYLGSDKLIAVYVLGGLAGGLVYLLMYNTIPFYSEQLAIMPEVVDRYKFPGMVGASAAVYAVVVAIATLIPDYTFFLLFLGPVRIKYIAAFYVVVSFVGTIGSNQGGNIAHLGGALIGFIYTKQLQAGVNWGSWITVTLQFFRDLFKPRPKVKVSYRSEKKQEPKKSGKPSVSQAELDAILDKISAAGYESLTKDEKEKLFNASKKQ
jgi:membrane associated rhomboid family serine protease